MDSSPSQMLLDGFVVETANEVKQGEEMVASLFSMPEPVPIIVPEPHMEQPEGVLGIPDNSGTDGSVPPIVTFPQEQKGDMVEEDAPMPAMPDNVSTLAIPDNPSMPAMPDNLSTPAMPDNLSTPAMPNNLSMPSQDEPKFGIKPVYSGNGENNDKADHKYYGNHYQGDASSSLPFELKHNAVVADDPILNTDAKALSAFLRHHGFQRPNFSVHMTGTHTETHVRQVADADGKGSHEERHTETITDFSFSIDLSDVFTEDPILYTVKDDVPAFRGAMRMAVESGGTVPIERRALVSGTVQSVQENAIEAGRRVGRPPWLISGDLTSSFDEAAMGATPQASSRTFEEWLEDYVQSKRVVKEFKFAKEVFAWDLNSLTTSIEQLIRSTGYRSTIRVQFQTSPKKVHVYSPNVISKIFSSYLLIFLTTVILIFPFLWMWRRWWPGAGGRWEVSGAAFRLKRWELLRGTYPGETEQAALGRLGGPQAISGTRFRAGRDGVWVLRGVHEADWFRHWEETIRCGVREKLRVQWLSRRIVVVEQAQANAIASSLDHL